MPDRQSQREESCQVQALQMDPHVIFRMDNCPTGSLKEENPVKGISSADGPPGF